MMQLDLPTLMVMQSFALACAGMVLLAAWSQNRTIPALALWGIAHIIAAGGILSLMLGFTSQQPIWLGLGGGLLSFQSALVWKAARNLDSKPVPLVIVVVGPMIVGLAGGVPGIREFAGSLSLAMGAAYTLATTTTLWVGRKDRLAARWPLVILSAVHAAALLVGVYSTFIGSTAQDTVPPIMSLFGFIYFESIVFALGTSVFLLALVKERNEAAGRMAARIDPLTGIANRGGFMERAERVVERCRRKNAPVSVMMFDLDRFKAVNDTHGHALGDAVIRTFCDVTAAALRPSDVFGRIGGEEFAVVLPGSSIEVAYARAERIRIAFAASCRFVAGRPVEATVSCGLSMSSNAEEALGTLLADSDTALYLAKAEGRNRVKRAGQPQPEGGLSTVIRVA
ncbi:MAG: GGDEF domain-containing protein [Xanthobacteraceae bacterium]|jgi:diguanylate cyclase (GGDEF)-like protein